jgi:hypothetical protein
VARAPQQSLRGPPIEIDEVTERFDRTCDALVRIEAVPLTEVRAAVDHFARALEQHCQNRDAGTPPTGPTHPPATADLSRLVADHLRFAMSVDQLRWFYGIVEHEDHGGNRQALGQYGRIAVEAVRLHREEERRTEERAREVARRFPRPRPPEQR